MPEDTKKKSAEQIAKELKERAQTAKAGTDKMAEQGKDWGGVVGTALHKIKTQREEKEAQLKRIRKEMGM